MFAYREGFFWALVNYFRHIVYENDNITKSAILYLSSPLNLPKN